MPVSGCGMRPGLCRSALEPSTGKSEPSRGSGNGSTGVGRLSILRGMSEETENPLGPSLSVEEIRVLGSLVEKSYTTPDYYPMTVNGLVNACNQKSSRSPVVEYDEQTVQRALDGLREKRWAILVHTAGARTIKYKHNIRHTFEFTDQEIALLCVLMLRGPQTVGEVRGRTGRMADFADLGEVESVLRELASGYPVALVRELPRQPGRKDHRFIQLLGATSDTEETAPPESPAVPAPSVSSTADGRIEILEEQVQTLREQLEHLQQEFQRFQQQFE